MSAVGLGCVETEFLSALKLRRCGSRRFLFSSVWASANTLPLRWFYRPNQVFHSQYLHHPLHVVGQHMKAHFRFDTRKRLHGEVRFAHPSLQSTEGMFDR